jgi:hypothetical protein
MLYFGVEDVAIGEWIKAWELFGLELTGCL